MTIKIENIWLIAGLFCFATFCYVVFFNPKMSEMSTQSQWALTIGFAAVFILHQSQIYTLERKLEEKKNG